MNPRVCIGCGEPIPEKGNALSRNPNLCASCSSMVDGMEELDAPKPAPPEQDRLLAHEKPAETRKAA
jgi:RNA polymerase-binding transcription factor DksA